MAHFAELGEDNIVLRVIVVSNDDCKDSEGTESEAVGAEFCRNLLGGTYTYRSDLDAYIAPKPYPSWSLNEETTEWEAPVTKPAEGLYTWDEANQEWDEVTLPA